MPKDLSDIMDFDHVIQVHEDGSISEPTGVYAPELYDGELISDKWEFFTTGYSGQDSYSGPIMHDSEFIGGQLERDILSTPGVYVALISYYSSDADGNVDENESYVEGWAIARLKDN